jgi:hypothetical protein
LILLYSAFRIPAFSLFCATRSKKLLFFCFMAKAPSDEWELRNNHSRKAARAALAASQAQTAALDKEPQS